MPVQKLIAKIKIAQRQLEIPEDRYHSILSKMFPEQMVQVEIPTCKVLSNDQALKLIRYFKDLGWIPKLKPKKYDDQKGDIYSATPQQKRKIEAMWHDLYRGNEETKHLRQFLFNHFKVSDIRFLDKDKAYDVIEALKSMTRRRGDTETRREDNANDSAEI